MSIGDVPWRAQVSVGACASFGKVAAAIQRSSHAGSLEGAANGNSSRDRNGALDLCRRVMPILVAAIKTSFGEAFFQRKSDSNCLQRPNTSERCMSSLPEMQALGRLPGLHSSLNR